MATRRSTARTAPKVSTGIGLCVTVLALAAVGATGCGGSDPEPAKAPTIVASTTQLGEIASVLSGSVDGVTTMATPAMPPENYLPSADNVKKLSQAKIILKSGGKIDSWLAPAVQQSGTKVKPLNLSQSVKLQKLSSGGKNMYWFTSLANLSLAADTISAELIKQNPAGTATYEANATRYKKRLKDVEDALLFCVGQIPKKKYSLVAGPADFDYIAKSYGMKIAAHLSQTKSDGSQPSEAATDAVVSKAKSGKAQLVTQAWGDPGVQAGAVAAKLDKPKIGVYTQALSVANGPAPTALLGVVQAVSSTVAALSQNKQSCTPPSDE